MRSVNDAMMSRRDVQALRDLIASNLNEGLVKDSSGRKTADKENPEDVMIKKVNAKLSNLYDALDEFSRFVGVETRKADTVMAQIERNI